jgi:hypothetical protein
MNLLPGCCPCWTSSPRPSGRGSSAIKLSCWKATRFGVFTSGLWIKMDHLDHFWSGFHCHLLHFFASIFAFACFQRFFSNLFSCGTLSVSLITVQTLHEGSPVQTGQSWNHGYLQVFCAFANLDFVSYWYCNLLDLDVIQALSYADSEKLW